MLFCVLNAERKYNSIINVRGNFFQNKKNMTFFVGQTKKESVTSDKVLH